MVSGLWVQSGVATALYTSFTSKGSRSEPRVICYCVSVFNDRTDNTRSAGFLGHRVNGHSLNPCFGPFIETMPQYTAILPCTHHLAECFFEVFWFNGRSSSNTAPLYSLNVGTGSIWCWNSSLCTWTTFWHYSLSPEPRTYVTFTINVRKLFHSSNTFFN